MRFNIHFLIHINCSLYEHDATHMASLMVIQSGVILNARSQAIDQLQISHREKYLFWTFSHPKSRYPIEILWFWIKKSSGLYNNPWIITKKNSYFVTLNLFVAHPGLHNNHHRFQSIETLIDSTLWAILYILALSPTAQKRTRWLNKRNVFYIN